MDGLTIRDMDIAANANMTLKLQVPPLEKATELHVFFMDKDGNRIRNSLITFSLPASQTAQAIDYPILTSLSAVRLRAWFTR